MYKTTHSLEQFKQYLQQNYPEPTTKINLGSQYQIPIGPEGIALLVDYLSWNIENINITMHNVGNEGMQILINSQLERKDKAWTGLKEIASIKNNITSQGLVGLDKVEWPNLEIFNFYRNSIDEMGVQILIRAKFTNSFKRLYLDNNNIGAVGCEILSRSNWPNLQRLSLNYNIIGNDGLAFLHLANWEKLIEINVANNKLDSRGMIYLEKANWPGLQIINLSKNNIGIVNQSKLTDMGCLHISKMKTNRLRHLSVFGTDMSLNGIRIIFRSPILVQQCFLQLTKNLFSFGQVKPYLQQFNLFCNEFQD